MKNVKNIEFMELYEMHHKDLSNFCRSLERDPEDAKELMSETISRAFQNFEKIKDKKKFKSFLFSVAHNVLKEKIRKKQRLMPIRSSLQQENTNNLEKHTLINILKELPEEQAEVFSLFEIADLPLAEIAIIQNTNISTIKTRLSRARKKLEEILKEEFTSHISNY